MPSIHEIFDQTELTILQQGLKVLHDESVAQRQIFQNRYAPGDISIPAILDGFDLRNDKLFALRSKLTDLANSS